MEKEYKLIKLENENYVIWKWQFRNVLRACQLLKVYNEEATVPEQNRALALLSSAISDENMLRIANCETFKEAWTTIERCYENKTTYEPQALYRRLNSFRMQNPGEVPPGLSEMSGIVAQLKNLGEEVSENCFIGAILSALPESFNVFITAWKNSDNKDVEGLIARLMAESVDQARKEQDVVALSAKGKKRGEMKKKRLEKDECRYCKERGHWIKDCPNLKGPYDPDHGKKKKEKYNKKDKDDDNTTDLAFMTKVTEGQKLTDEDHVADSGCTAHMSPYQYLFKNMRESEDYKSVQLADSGRQLEVKGKGEIETDKGTLKNVLYVPTLAQNLFSVRAAASNELTSKGSKNGLTFFYGDKEIMTAPVVHNLHALKLKPVRQSAMANSATLKEWHERLGHVTLDTIKLMKQNQAVDDLVINENPKDKCEDCALNKCTRAHHQTRSTRKSDKPGTVLHMDLAGPSNVESRNKSRYLLLCKCEASKYRMVAFTQTKDQVTNQVKKLINKAVLDTGNQVLYLCSDNGSEFVNKNMTDFFDSRGIIHDKSAPYVAPQNGLIERDIRTIKEAAKTLLNKAKLDRSLWPEAVSCAVYALNRVINSTNDKKTPYKL